MTSKRKLQGAGNEGRGTSLESFLREELKDPEFRRLYNEKKAQYTDEPIGELRVIQNFSPPPEKLVLQGREAVKVTMVLSKSSVAYYKRAAKKRRMPYHVMIEKLIEAYPVKHSL